MIKNRTTQLIFQTVYCTLGVVGFIACLGIFDDIKSFRWDFYVHFTNQTNILCIGIMFAELIQTIKKTEDSYTTVNPFVKFVGMVSILFVFLVFNIMLAGQEGRDPQLNWRIGSLLFHVVLPVMYIADWILFYERRKTKKFYPFAAITTFAVYVVFIFIHAAILKFDSSIMMPGTTGTPLIYSYFFLNIDNLGVVGVAKWILLGLCGFTLLGVMFRAVDMLLGKKKAQ